MIHCLKRMIRMRLVAIATLVVLLTLCASMVATAGPVAAVKGGGQAGQPEPAPGEIIVKFKSPASAGIIAGVQESENLKVSGSDIDVKSLKDLGAKHGVYSIEPVFKGLHRQMKDEGKTAAQIAADAKAEFPVRAKRAPTEAIPPDLSGVFLLKFPEDADVNAVAADYRNDQNAEFAEPNNRLKAMYLPDDPYFRSTGSWGQSYPDMWNLRNIDAEHAWDVARGSGITVAVVDTGVDRTHTDLQANVWTNADEVASNGIDDDHNGYVDDRYGYDMAYNDNNPADGDGHGTHVAGTIAAVDNTIGVIGLAPQARVMPLKGLDDSGGGTDADMAEAIRYATNNGADIQNYSWGSSLALLFPATRLAIIDAYANGSVLVAAAGNDYGADVANFFPANMDQVITVSSVTQNDQLSDFSNVGAGIDVAAPGGGHVNWTPPYTNFYNVLSLRATGTDMVGGGHCIVGTNYYRCAGTSMAAPHVAGLAALVLSELPTISNERVREIMRSSADDLGAPGFDEKFGAGRIDAYQAMQLANISVKSIKPNLGFIGTTVVISSLNGTGFEPGATVRLRLAGYPDINATNVTVLNDTIITCKVNLTGATAGAYTVYVKNTNGEEAAMTAKFTVAQCGPGAGAATALAVGLLGLLSAAGFIRSRRKLFGSLKRSA